MNDALIVIKNSLSSLVFVLAIAAIITVGVISLYGNFNWKWLWMIMSAMLLLHITDLMVSYATGIPVTDLGCIHNCGQGGAALRGPGRRVQGGGQSPGPNPNCQPGMGAC